MSECHPIRCQHFSDSQGVSHKMLCPKHMGELIKESLPEPEPKTVDDCVVDSVYKEFKGDLNTASIRGIMLRGEEHLYKSIIRHTLNAVLEMKG